MISYDILWYPAIFYDILWYSVTFCDILWYPVIFYDMIWYSVIFYDIPWYSMNSMIFYDILDWCIARGLLILSLNVNVLFSGGSALSFCIGPATQTQATLSVYLKPAVIVWCAGKVLRTSPTLKNSTASLIARLQEDHSALQRERDAFEEEKVGFACNIHSPGRYRRKTVETESW